MHFLLSTLQLVSARRRIGGSGSTREPALKERARALVRAISVKELEHLHNFMSILNLELKFRQSMSAACMPAAALSRAASPCPDCIHTVTYMAARAQYVLVRSMFVCVDT